MKIASGRELFYVCPIFVKEKIKKNWKKRKVGAKEVKRERGETDACASV